ncbi:MAG: glycosyltransferase family 4 protein [Clostridia bacterium]|nr:glycosyltransferase family 4 protein [Clostridia bacterium]
MNILYIAYSCSPVRGSEDKIGWNIALTASEIHNVFVITKEEHRKDIEAYIKNNGISNIKFFYVDIPKIYKKVFKGALYSGRLNRWQKRAFPVARKICSDFSIDIIHQITPVEFRAVGDYGKIENIKYVFGPIGGGEQLPKGLKYYTKGNRLTESVRAMANRLYRFKFRLTNKFNKVDCVMYANRETKDYLSRLNIKGNVLYSEIGLSQTELQVSDSADILPEHKEKNCHLLVAGRTAYRKGHSLLLDALKSLPDSADYQCRIVGAGPELQKLKAKCKSLGLEKRVVFTGRIPFDQMTDEYRNADVFIMPSLRETTGTVVLEAVSKGLPVVTINRFGGSLIVDNEIGWVYDGSSKQEFIDNLTKAISECLSNPQDVARKGMNARVKATDYLWEEKVRFYTDIYKSL